MKTYDVLSAVQHLATAMARAEQAVGAERCARVQQAALTDAVGGVAPLGLSAEQMGRVAAHLEAEVLLDDPRRGGAAPAGVCA